MELEEYVVLEIKGDVDPLGFRIDMETCETSFWQLYQFMNTSKLIAAWLN